MIERTCKRNSDEQLPSENGLMHYVDAVYRRRWIALTTFVVVMTYAALQTFTTMPVYEASSQLLIKADERNVLTFEDVVKQDRASYDYAETQYRLLRSRALARRTLTALDMWNRPPFGGAAPTPPATPSFSIRDAIRSQSGGPGAATSHADVRASAANENKEESAAIDRLLGGVTIAPIRNSQLVDVNYRSPDPRLAARVVNELVRQYIAQAEDERVQALSGRIRVAHQTAGDAARATGKERDGTAAISRAERRGRRSRTRRTSSCRSWPI